MHRPKSMRPVGRSRSGLGLTLGALLAFCLSGAAPAVAAPPTVSKVTPTCDAMPGATEALTDRWRVFLTGDLDEGPIIEQAVERVSHSLSPEDYMAVGRDIENAVLARAIKWHCEHRIMLNGRRTVIFP